MGSDVDGSGRVGHPASGGGLRAKSLWGGIWSTVETVGSAGIGLVGFLLLARVLGPRDYGLMGMVDVVLTFGLRVMSAGLSEPLIHRRELEPIHSDTLFWTVQAAGVALMATAAGGSGLIASIFGMESLAPLLLVAAAVIQTQALAMVPEALLARRFRFAAVARSSLIAETTGTVVAVVLAHQGAGVWSLVVQRMVGSGLKMVLLFVAAGWRPRLRWSASCFKEMWGFSASRCLDGLLLYIEEQAPRLIIGRFVGVTELGHYLWARRVLDCSVLVLSRPLRSTGMSTIAAIQGDPERIRRVYAEGLALSALVMLPSAAGMCWVAGDLVSVLAGAQWTPAAVMLQLLVFAALRTTFHVWTGAILRGLGRPELLLIPGAIRSGLTLALGLAFVRWGGVGVCLGILGSAVLSTPIALAQVRKVVGIRPWEQIQPLAAVFQATVFMSAGVGLFRWGMAGHLDPILSLLATALVGVLLMVGGMFLFGREDLRRLLRNLRALQPAPARTGTARNDRRGPG